MQKFDFVIIGGGIFGVYSAIFLAKNKYKVCLIEKEHDFMLKASIVNQARLHAGYHYPRSIATAKIADEFKERFYHEHKRFTNNTFNQFYAIDKYNSFTDTKQFERFCRTLGIKCKIITHHHLINFNRIGGLYLTEEFSFDPILISDYYRHQIKNYPNISIYLNSKINAVDLKSGTWEIGLSFNNDIIKIETESVINATYSGTNTINKLFGIPPIKIMHEITEMAMISAPALDNFGLTIMDGHFMSIMPYGLSGLHSLSSVAYTVHKVSYDDEPVFDCQQIIPECKPNFISVCDKCQAKPVSNKNKMIHQAFHYLNPNVELNYKYSMFTIKSKLKSSFIDDGRPTEISQLHHQPNYYCLFAGKINSIYEIEKFVSHEF